MLLLSSSSLSTFKHCRKAYELGYERLLSPVQTSEVVERGTSIHRMLEQAAKGEQYGEDATFEEVQIVNAYLAHNPLPRDIIGAEMPFWVPVLGTVAALRGTFDLVYRDGDWIVGRDYKTFKTASPIDADLDYQGRIYLAMLEHYYKTDRVRFEYVQIRQTPPGVPHNKRGDVWMPADCYMTTPLVMPQREIDVLWEETRWVVQDILETQESGYWYRQDRKGFGGCGSCFYRDLCKAELQQGALDEQTIAMLSTPHEPLQLPPA